jgi:hypothetical protein
MKKLMFVIVAAASFAACNDTKTKTESKTDTLINKIGDKTDSLTQDIREGADSVGAKLERAGDTAKAKIQDKLGKKDSAD